MALIGAGSRECPVSKRFFWVAPNLAICFVRAFENSPAGVENGVGRMAYDRRARLASFGWCDADPRSRPFILMPDCAIPDPRIGRVAASVPSQKSCYNSMTRV